MSLFGIICDMDGVIIDSEIYNSLSYTKALERYNVILEPDYFKKFVGIPLTDIVTTIEKEHKITINFDEFREEANNYQRELMNGEHPETIGPLYIRPDLEILLEDLSRNEVPMVVATSSSKKRAYWILEKIGIISEIGIKYFSSILTKEDVSKNKPSPEMFLRAKSKLGTPRYCVVIEDSPTGVEAAKNAGMYAIALLTDSYKPEDFDNADLIIKNFDELNYQALKRLIENRK